MATVDVRGLVPVGLISPGHVFYVVLSHLLVVGQTGSGKGSVIWAFIMGVEFMLEQQGQGGLVRFYGLDPKRAELSGVRHGFVRIAFDPEDALSLLSELVGVMRSRQRLGLRSFTCTPDMPWIVLVIDEFNSVESSADLKWKREMKAALNSLLSQGRSAGIVVLAAAQQGQREAIGPYRDHFVTRIALRVGSRVETDVILGAGATENGALPHEIPPASVSNGYRTAGVGYGLSLAHPGFVRFRAPFVSDGDIRRWDEAHKPQETIIDGRSS